MTCPNCKCPMCTPYKPKAPRVTYPWKEWFDGTVRILVRGQHYQCTTERMQSNVFESAARRGVRAHAYVDGDTLRVWVDGKRRIPVRCLTVEQQRKLAAGCEVEL